MTRTIPHRELRNNSGAVLRTVSHGKIVAVTNRGEVVAIPVPPETLGPGCTCAKRPHVAGFAMLPRLQLDHPAQHSLDDLRGER